MFLQLNMKTVYPTEISVGKILDPRKAVKSLNLSGKHLLSKSTLIENFLLFKNDFKIIFFKNHF